MKTMHTLKTTVKVLESIWDPIQHKAKCPKCSSNLTIIQAEPLNQQDSLHTTYKTIIECDYCDFTVITHSYTILGCVNDYDHHNITIAGWTDTGSREVNTYEHLLDYGLLKSLKKTGELVEFLIVNDHAVQIIG